MNDQKRVYEPGGEAWRENLERHGGHEYEGGPVPIAVWDEWAARRCSETAEPAGAP